MASFPDNLTTDEDRALWDDFDLSLVKPFDLDREDQSWDDVAWETAVSGFVARHGQEAVDDFWKRWSLVPLEILVMLWKPGKQEFMKPGWKCPLLGQTIANLPALLDDPAAILWEKGGAAGWRDAKVLVFEFWATLCGPCKAKFPELSKLAEDHPEPELKIFGIAIENLGQGHETPDDIANFKTFVRDRDDMHYNVGIDVAHKVKDVIYDPTDFPAIPLVVVVTPTDGFVHFAAKGEVDYQDVVRQLLSKA